MRDFIKKITQNHTPRWWDGWCWFALVMLVWSIGWAAFGSLAFARGFQLGMAFYWIGFLVVRVSSQHTNDLLGVYRELNQLNNKVMTRQRETIALKNETIRVQNEHIEMLKGNK